MRVAPFQRPRDRPHGARARSYDGEEHDTGATRPARKERHHAETALVTGATSGIGESLCLLFASDGYDLVTVARDEEALEKQAKDLRVLGIDVLPVACDLSDPDAARTIFKRVQEAGKEIEILVNDAGYSPAGQFSDLPIADIRSMIQSASPASPS